MKFARLRSIRRGQWGFTLIELLVAITIAGVITGGITAAVMQVLTINTRASNHMIAVRQVQQAGKEVSKDTLQAQNVTWSGNPGFNLTLTWKDIENAENVVVYTIDDGELERSHSINGTAEATARPVVAEYIDPDQTGCVLEGGVLTFTVTAVVGNGSNQASETRVYEIEPRPTPPSG
jgi:prepilin-type N-terminal cleavage/methylation domain-containing protein